MARRGLESLGHFICSNRREKAVKEREVEESLRKVSSFVFQTLSDML
jgi:hypothetical protein